jgi:hypothetical protein
VCVEAFIFVAIGEDVHDQILIAVFRVFFSHDANPDIVREKPRGEFLGVREKILDGVPLTELDHFVGVMSDSADLFFLMRDFTRVLGHRHGQNVLSVCRERGVGLMLLWRLSRCSVSQLLR